MTTLPFNKAEQRLLDKATSLEARASVLREQANSCRTKRDLARPLKDRLSFAAYDRCNCGHGMAYDPTGEVASNKEGHLRTPSQWECSAILLGIAREDIAHSAPLPFAFYEVKSESQPSAHGATTREPREGVA